MFRPKHSTKYVLRFQRIFIICCFVDLIERILAKRLLHVGERFVHHFAAALWRGFGWVIGKLERFLGYFT